MLKKIVPIVFGVLLSLHVQAFDKAQVNLSKDFWGTWTIINPKTQCTEVYKFTQPDQFTYNAKQKNMTGKFGMLRNSDVKVLDLLVLEVKADNKQAGCAAQATNYTNTTIQLALKWLSPQTAELCNDRDGKKCLGLYITKQK
jgi:hypothetical protein